MNMRSFLPEMKWGKTSFCGKRSFPHTSFKKNEFFAAAIMFAMAAAAFAQEVAFIEAGHDIGDGNVRYNTPYDPKAVSEITFVRPTVEHPYYEIVVPLGDWTEGASAAIKELRVNGLKCESYYVFVDGFSHVQSGWITRTSSTAPNVVVVARMLWHNGAKTAIEIDIDAKDEQGAQRTVTKNFEAKAPAQGGGPKGWRRYQSLLLEEKAGIERKGEPVEFSVTVRAEDCGDLEKELRVFELGAETLPPKPVPVQTFNAKSFAGTPPGTSNENYLQHPSKSVEAVFLAGVPANGAKVYLVCYDNPDAPKPELAPTDLAVIGPDLGATVENAHYKVELDKRSGQIAAFHLKGPSAKPVPTLTNSYSYAVHWNPDSFSDNGKWGHTFSWNPPDHTLVTTRGPLMFRVTNRGRMPEYTPQIHTSVTYSFYAGVPYVKCVTATEVRDPLNASAIRNGEIVLDTHLITHFVWEEKTGELRGIETLHGPNWQDEWATRVDHDAHWLAMTNELDDYGIGVIVEDSLAFNPNRGEATQHRPAYYLYYHHFWGLPLTYFTRGWVYPFSDYQRGPILPVDAGSTYIEKMAFIPFHLHESPGRYREITEMSAQVHHPLVQRWGR